MNSSEESGEASSLLDTKSRRGADVGSDRHLMLVIFMVKLVPLRTPGCSTQFKYNVRKLNHKPARETFTTDQIAAKSDTPRGIAEDTWVGEYLNPLNVGGAQGNVQNHSAKKEETRHGMDGYQRTPIRKPMEESTIVREKMNQFEDVQEMEKVSRMYTALNKKRGEEEC
ncbi:unnamed protein product [Trichobilharzia regenti]|nr:unnamed protein product [Trichobilharzia regenti]